MRRVWELGSLGRTGSRPPGAQLLFGQMREDPETERRVLREVPGSGDVVTIASAGCCAFTLATEAPAVFALDINPAQIALCRLKQAILTRLDPQEILTAFERCAAPAYLRVASSLAPDAAAFWNDRRDLLRRGLQQTGLIDRRLRQANFLSLPFLSRAERLRLFEAASPAAQERHFRFRWKTRFWDLGLKLLLSRPLLRLVYGADLLRSLPSGYRDETVRQLERVITRLPARENPYLAQLFLNRYWPPEAPVLPGFLEQAGSARSREAISRVTFLCSEAAEWLDSRPPGSIRFFGLSNILEIADDAFARRLWKAVRRTAAPAHRIVLRSMFHSPLFWADRHHFLKADPSLSAELTRGDRSGSCSHIAVFQVKGI